MVTNEGEKTDKVALFDMDNSLANFAKAMKRDLELVRSPEEPPYSDDLWAAERHPHIKARMRLIKSQPGWWLNLEPIQDGLTVLNLAREIGYRCDILTKGPRSHPAAWKEKIEWSNDHLPADTDVHIVMNKGLVYGTLLYDDFPEYMESWLQHRPRGLGIMPRTESNKSYFHPRVVMWDGSNLDKVEAAMRKAYQRDAKMPLDLQ